MPKTQPGKLKTKSKKLSPALTVTIVVAAIGCLGTVVAAFVTGAFAFLSSNGIPDFTGSGDTPPDDWQGIVSITHGTPCPSLFYPDALFSGSDKASWIQENASNYHTVEQLMYAPYLESSHASNEIEIHLTISSIVETGDWIRLARDASITVTRLDDEPDVATLVRSSDCGGGAFFRYFSPVPLRADFDKYESDTSTSDADYFTLQPGEPEIFVFTVSCEAPGLYRVDMNLPYTYQNIDGRIVFTDIRGVACPRDAEYYTAGIIPGIDETVVLDVATYTWNGSEYEKTGP